MTAAGGERVVLVEAVMQFLDEWQALLKEAQRLTPERVSGMLDRAEELRAQADRAGQGAILHQLEVCIACLRAPALDRRAVLEALRSLSEVTWQLKQEVSPRRAAGSDAGPRSLAPPPLLSGSAPPQPARSGVEPPPPLSLPGLAGGAPQPVLGASRAGGLAPVPSRGPAPHVDPARSVAPPPHLSPEPAPEPRPPEPVDGLFQRPGPEARPAARPASPVLGLGQRPGPPPPAKAKDRPNLMVATMFGLRAFGRKKGAAPAPVAPASPPPRERARSVPPGGVLGLGQRSGMARSDEPAWIGPRAGGLPELPTPGGAPRNRPGSPLDEPLPSLGPGGDRREERRGRPSTVPPGDRRSRPSTYPPVADRARSGSRVERADRLGGRRERREGALPVPWWIGGVAVVLVGLIVVGLLVFGRSSSTAQQAQVVGGGDDTPLPTSKLLDEKERMRALIAAVHNYGGGESPELADLVNEEAALVNEVLQKSCDQPGDRCDRPVPMIAGTSLSAATPENKIQHLFEERKITSASKQTGRVPKWLAGLQLPIIGVGDNPMVQQKVEYFTQTQNGREEFQNLLFRCGAYRDLIERSLVDAGLPRSLLALVMTESGCVSHAESPVGARGLWQFMPATGRAYHLHIKENLVDERISPRKSTAAAVRYLADLRRKMGSWEFAMASYNMGPFGLASRIRRAGGDVTFWDLAENGFLPDETARYVPRIQAYALILENLGRFNFSMAQMRATEMTDELEAPAGTRLSLIARAASTSFDHLKLLNPDIVGVAVPDLGGERFMVQVPRDDAGRARSVLQQLLAAGDQNDRCVSSGFDWGSERFSEDMCGGGGVSRPRRRAR